MSERSYHGATSRQYQDANPILKSLMADDLFAGPQRPVLKPKTANNGFNPYCLQGRKKSNVLFNDAVNTLFTIITESFGCVKDHKHNKRKPHCRHSIGQSFLLTTTTTG